MTQARHQSDLAFKTSLGIGSCKRSIQHHFHGHLATRGLLNRLVHDALPTSTQFSGKGVTAIESLRGTFAFRSVVASLPRAALAKTSSTTLANSPNDW